MGFLDTEGLTSGSAGCSWLNSRSWRRFQDWKSLSSAASMVALPVTRTYIPDMKRRGFVGALAAVIAAPKALMAMRFKTRIPAPKRECEHHSVVPSYTFDVDGLIRDGKVHCVECHALLTDYAVRGRQSASGYTEVEVGRVWNGAWLSDWNGKLDL